MQTGLHLAHQDLRCSRDDHGLSTRLRRNWKGLPERSTTETLNQFPITECATVLSSGIIRILFVKTLLSVR